MAANRLLVTIGTDTQRPGKFYWQIAETFSRDVILVRRDFSSREAAKEDLARFKDDLKCAASIENIASED